MRALFTFGSLLLVLAIVALTLRAQLQASKRLLPTSAASGAASTPFDGNHPAQSVAQYQRDLDKAMKAAQRSADQAASAADDGAR